MNVATSLLIQGSLYHLSQMDTLKHFLHDHALYRRKLSQHCDLLECEVCMSRIHGSTSMYCCEGCGFYLHPSCAAEIPSQIEHHPLHPDHPLTLRCGDGWHGVRDPCCAACERRLKFKTFCKKVIYSSGTSWTTSHDPWGFSCSSCPFHLHVGCAMVSLLPDGESGPEHATFEHFAHGCPLALLNVKPEYNIECEACGVRLSGEEEYGCRSCFFFLHKTCAEWPQEIRRHPFHSHHPLALVIRQEDPQLQCRACGRGAFSGYRCCEDCGFDLCLDCTNVGCPRVETEDHFFHQHPLAFYYTQKEMQFLCKACDQPVSGEFYGCPDCSFFVHEPCVQSLPREIKHYLHPIADHSLTLCPTPPDESESCRGCYDSLGRDFAYKCKACDFHLHVPCALQTLAYLEQGASKMIEIPMMGQYKLTHVHAQGSSRSSCDRCGEHCQGPAYWHHAFLLHKSCAEELSILEPFHHQHRLEIVHPSSHSVCKCKVCGEPISSDYTYSCGECPDSEMHLSCIRKPTVKHPLHAHGLSYFQKKSNSNSLCKACGKRCVVDLYHCEVCNVHIHYDCFQIPITIKSNHHIDELALHESIVEDDSGEYYCDICEERRDPKLWAYYCKVCQLIAHVVCAVSPVKLNVVVENPELEELDRRIEEAQKRVDYEKEDLEKLMRKLEALKTRRATVAYE